jgi:hypothetical protein
MIYEILIRCKPRRTPTMYEANTLAELPIGKRITSTVSHTVVSPGKVDNGVVFIQDESTSYWIPLIYGGYEYARKAIDVIPPVTTDVIPVEVLVTSSDGAVYKFTNPVKV